jgi:hypothetical protein
MTSLKERWPSPPRQIKTPQILGVYRKNLEGLLFSPPRPVSNLLEGGGRHGRIEINDSLNTFEHLGLYWVARVFLGMNARLMPLYAASKGNI